MLKVGEYICGLMRQSGLDQRDLALQAGMPFQNVSAVLAGQRELTPGQSVLLDDVFGLDRGTIFRMQADESVEGCRDVVLPSDLKRGILLKVKENGGLWSYDGIPGSFSDDDVIEQGLRHLDLEDLYLLSRLWSPSHIKRVWKARLVSEGRRSNILNTILGVVFFGMGYEQTQKYLLNYGHK